MTPNMANITQLHGYMKIERFELKLDIIKYTYGPVTLTPWYYDEKQEIIHLRCTLQ